MSRAPEISQGQIEKAAAGWVDGMHSGRSPWLIRDTQYQSGVNVVNRGGIVQTRPGYAAQVSLPPGKLQGLKFFEPTKSASQLRPYLVAAVSGKIYALPFPLVQPVGNDFTPYQLPGISFSATAPQIYWEIGEKSTSLQGVELIVVPTHRVLVMQDGVSQAAYWDGELAAHSDEAQNGVPIGTWMAWSGNRLWVARGTFVIPGDYLDPLTFYERTQQDIDFAFDGVITGFAKSVADSRQASLIVGTAESMYTINSSVRDSSTWLTGSTQLVNILYPSIGVRAGASFTNHAGLLWWHDGRGLLNSDIAATTYLTSKINYRDVEMSRVKSGLASDLSGVCAISFDNCLLVSVPVNDTFNSITMVLDSSIADELNSESAPAWVGAWTGIRPVAWATGTVDGENRIFAASVDYVELDGSPNRIWEAFQSDRRDSYELVTVDNARRRTYNQIFCEFETKALGDGRDLKKFKFMDADLTEIGGTVNLQASFAGLRGGYRKILNKKIVSTMDRTSNSQVQSLYDYLGGFSLQRRRVSSETTGPESAATVNVENEYDGDIDSAFSLLFQWCGRMGIEALRLFTEPVDERPEGICEEDEAGLRILTLDGKSVVLDEDASLEATQAFPMPRLGYAFPVSQKYRDSFYSSIPVVWQDIAGKCLVCLPCVRDTFTAPTKQDIIIDNEVIY